MTDTYTPAQKAAYKAMRAVEMTIEHTGRSLENLVLTARGMKATGDTEGVQLIAPVLKHLMSIRKTAKAELHSVRAAYYALFTDTPGDITLTDDETAAFEALAASLED